MEKEKIRLEAARLAVESGETGISIINMAKRIETYVMEGK